MSDSKLIEISLRTDDGAVLHMEGPPAGRAVLVLHGLGYASWAADPLRHALGEDLGLWSLDNRGTGRSTPGRRPFSIEQFAADAAHAVEALRPPITVVGYSMGGYIAQLLALTRPELVSSLILIGTSAGGTSSVPVPEATREAWLDAVGTPPEAYAERTMPFSFRDGWPESNAANYERIIRSRLAHPTPADTWRAQYDACERFLRTGSQISKIATSTLVLQGAADRVLPVGNGRAIAEALPSARYREVPAAGHLLHLEEPDLVAAEIHRLHSLPSRPAENDIKD